MATTAELLVDLLGRVREHVHGAVDGLSEQQLAHRIDGRANSIAWLVWHQARVTDDHVADAAGTGQVWTEEAWADRFGLAQDPTDTGYGHTPEQVSAVHADARTLTGYAEAVVTHATTYARRLSDADLDRVVDEDWDPPVTLAVRLISVVDDAIQHLGQAAFARGLLAD